MKKFLIVAGVLLTAYVVMQWSRADYLAFAEQRDSWQRRCLAYVGSSASVEDPAKAMACTVELREMLAYAKSKGWDGSSTPPSAPVTSEPDPDADWNEKLRQIAERNGHACSAVVSAVHEAPGASPYKGGNVWTIRCQNGAEYSVLLRRNEPPLVSKDRLF